MTAIEQNMAADSSQTPQHSLSDLDHAMDLLGDHSIASYYEDVSTQIRCTNSEFDGCHWHPAGTAENLRADGAQFTNNTFDGMGPDDVTYLNGNHTNTQIDNCRGGTFVINGQVDGLNIEGASAAVHMGTDSLVNHMVVNGDTQILDLQMAPGATVCNSNLGTSIVAASDDLRGTKWQNVEINGPMRDIDFAGSQFTNFQSNGGDFTRSNFEGCTLTGCRFDNTTGLDLTGAASLKDVTVNGFPVQSPKDLATVSQLAEISKTMQNAWASIRAPADPAAGFSEPAIAAYTSPPSGQQADTSVSTMAAAMSGIGGPTSQQNTAFGGVSLSGVGGGHDVDEASLHSAVATQPRTIALEDQATPATMAAISQRMNASA